MSEAKARDVRSRAEAIDLIEIERQRQISVEGWTPEHDDQHEDGQMLRAAVMYFQNAARPEGRVILDADGRPIGWPWEREWWKPKNKFRDLVRAGALCMAERDRIWRQNKTVHRQFPVPDRFWPNHIRHKFNMIVSELQAA